MALEDYQNHLLPKGRDAMVAAVELYNKPCFRYRDESCTILMVNAWELVLKALLSKAGRSIFQPLGESSIPFSAISSNGNGEDATPLTFFLGDNPRTLSLRETLAEAKNLFPESIEQLPVVRNIELLARYRDSTVHLITDAEELTLVVYRLAQASVANFRDLLSDCFDTDFEKELGWRVSPLGLSRPPVPIRYQAGDRILSEVEQNLSTSIPFVEKLVEAIEEVEKSGGDLGRLLTLYVDVPETRTSPHHHKV